MVDNGWNAAARSPWRAAVAGSVLEKTAQRQAADAAFMKWLMTHEKGSSVFTTVSTLVDSCTDNPAAKLTAQQILERVQRAQGQRAPA